jgi:hypothetical protein
MRRTILIGVPNYFGSFWRTEMKLSFIRAQQPSRSELHIGFRLSQVSTLSA